MSESLISFKKVLYIQIFSLLLSSCAEKLSPYRFETSTINLPSIKIVDLTTRFSAGNIILNGKLFCNKKLGPPQQGNLVIKIYSPTRELLNTQYANYPAPISLYEWRQAGVNFSAQLAITPPKDSLIEVGFDK